MAGKKGFFQKADQKKQYSENVLNNVDSVYRPKNRGRVKNPMSSNTMSGEEPGTLEGFDEQVAEVMQKSSLRNPVGYAFAGPQAKRQKMEAQAQANASAKVVAAGDDDLDSGTSATVFAAPPGFAKTAQPVPEVNAAPVEYADFVEIADTSAPEPEIQVRTGRASKKKTDVAIQKSKPKNSRKLSQPEIQVRTGALAPKLSQPEIQVRTGALAPKPSQPEIRVRRGSRSKKLSLPEIQVTEERLEEKTEAEVQPITGLKIDQQVAIELIQVADVLEAMQALEADVQESQGHYEPLQESEIQLARSLGFEGLFFKAPRKIELQYELDLSSPVAVELQQEQVEPENAAPIDLDAPDEIDAQDEAIDDTVDDALLCAEAADLYDEPLLEAASAAELGLVFEPQNYRKDTKKTQFLTIPKQGIKRSNRGTIEAVFQPNGKVVEAQYNRCGILIEVSVAGAMKLTRSAETGKWTMSYSDGSQPDNSISSVNFDRHGNLSYRTEDGTMTVICSDGSIIQTG